MLLKTYITDPGRPHLGVRYTLRLYKDLMTDVNNECAELGLSVNQFVLMLIEDHFRQKAVRAFHYASELRPAWQKKQAERSLPLGVNG